MCLCVCDRGRVCLCLFPFLPLARSLALALYLSLSLSLILPPDTFDSAQSPFSPEFGARGHVVLVGGRVAVICLHARIHFRVGHFCSFSG